MKKIWVSKGGGKVSTEVQAQAMTHVRRVCRGIAATAAFEVS